MNLNEQCQIMGYTGARDVSDHFIDENMYWINVKKSIEKTEFCTEIFFQIVSYLLANQSRLFGQTLF